VRKAILDHRRDFAALLFVFVVAVAIGGYILANQRLNLPGWVPGLGKDTFTLETELSNAQAVVPGQGQTVTIAGVKVGDIGSVELEDGVAVVEMNLDEEYRGRVYRDATVLLRPKTGLKDMYLQLSPGTPTAGELEENGRIPVSNTLPDVNPDEVLATLDRDTRDYLRVLLNAGAEALGDEQGGAEGQQSSAADLREAFKRFEPTARDAKAITVELAKRRQNLRRVVHNFQLLATELGDHDRELAAFVDSANANFEALANQDQNLREALRLLPGTLEETRTTLRKTGELAGQLGPTLEKLRPAARALGPSLRETRPFLRETTPIIREQLRPFSRDVRPTVRDLRGAAERLSVVTPRLTRVFGFVNDLLNTLAYNPPGSEEGYLFWASWVNHAGATVFETQDAHGPIRRGLVFVSCPALGVLDQVKASNPALQTLVELLNAPRQSDVCPGATP
jgi:phospholipid/cholesterol/gamma-HCH transport system substrate-binding protein